MDNFNESCVAFGNLNKWREYNCSERQDFRFHENCSASPSCITINAFIRELSLLERSPREKFRLPDLFLWISIPHVNFVSVNTEKAQTRVPT